LLACGTDAADARWVAAADLPAFKLTAKAAAVIRKALELARETARGIEYVNP
jgi:hypothetical protein